MRRTTENEKTYSEWLTTVTPHLTLVYLSDNILVIILGDMISTAKLKEEAGQCTDSVMSSHRPRILRVEYS